MNPAAAINQPETQFQAGVDACARLLDGAQIEIGRGGGGVSDAVWRLVYGLASIRSRASRAEWKSCVLFCRQHPLLPVLHEDPYAARAYRKPRGYPGDAGIIDYLYRVSPSQAERSGLTATGRLLLAATTTTPSGFAVRERKRLVALEIETVAEQTNRPTVVAVAAGHLREAACSEAVRLGRVGRFIAIDQDPKSLDTVQADYGNLDVECRQLSVRDLLQGAFVVDNADLIYALGLYDYLRDSAAGRLTQTLVRMLAPGGRLLIANLMPGIPEVGYMEAISDWYLTYRAPQELVELAAGSAGCTQYQSEVWTDNFGCIAYMRLTRARNI
jgi:extracellular factor (EF) 3-hydroxypalmitic acid methyl ester biosynthesis protein